MRVEIRQLTKTFGAYSALEAVSLDVREGEFCALLGPSGSGKTTLLRIIAGLEFPDGGEVRFAGENVVARDARERQVGFVFQHYALFRHMSVFENVAFGLRVRPRRSRPPEREIRARVMELLRLVQLDGLAGRYPNQLSGGQRQRVALARALAIEPRVLLLDEPFGALDAKVRKDLRRWLRDLHQRLGLTSVFVTHDQEEALELADQVVVLRQGRIEQIGSPRQIYDRPATPFVYEFLGSANCLPCRVQAGSVDVAGGRFEAPQRHRLADGPAWLFVRPHDLAVETAGRAPGIPGTLSAVVTTGPTFRLQLRLEHGEAEVEAEIAKSRFDALRLAPGMPVRLRPLEFGLFAAEETGAAPAVPPTRTQFDRPRAAVA
ncbi:MAG TPA: sulfate/molybdate ABC transporter ATP-binding protein [Geminicoccaceae bacterium]|nr:sulfate/molybdate ABC transporter ATP-binding protein [Geminicoccaceae bacterium]